MPLTCASYSTKTIVQPQGRESNKLPCKIEFADSVREIDRVEILALLKTYGNSEATPVIAHIDSVYKYRGAKGLEFLTVMTLGLFPSWTPEEPKYEIKFVREKTLLAHYEIFRSMFSWLLAIPFAYWPTSNEERLKNSLVAAFSKNCLEFQRN